MRIEVEEAWCAMDQMKIGQVSGSSRVAMEMLEAGWDKCLKFLINIFNDILLKDK